MIRKWWKESAAIDDHKGEDFWRTRTLLCAGEVLIQEVNPEDVEGLRKIFSGRSRETIYLRLHLLMPNVPEQWIALLTRGNARAWTSFSCRVRKRDLRLRHVRERLGEKPRS